MAGKFHNLYMDDDFTLTAKMFLVGRTHGCDCCSTRYSNDPEDEFSDRITRADLEEHIKLLQKAIAETQTMIDEKAYWHEPSQV